VGAGPTGVELAGQIAELSRRALKGNYRSIDPGTARIILVEAGDTVLASFPGPLQRRARQDLEWLAIEVRLQTMVTGVDEHGLDIQQNDHSTGRIQACTKIWAAGIQASSLGGILAEQSEATVDRAGRVSVPPDCTLPGRPEVFVVGDLMQLKNLPGVAEVVIQSGIHAARTIVHRLRGGTGQRSFRYRDLGTMATIARFRGCRRRPIARHRARRLAAVAGGAPGLPDRIREPPRGRRELDRCLPGTWAPAMHDHGAAGVCPHTCGRRSQNLSR
jgi:NADH dehydrogenase